MRSIRGRLIALVLAAEFGCALIFSGAELLHERTSRLHAFDVMLQGRSDSVLGAIQDAEDPEDNVAVDPKELKLPGEDVYAVYGADGRLLGSSPEAPPALIQRIANGFRVTHFRSHTYRIYQRDAMRIIDRSEDGGEGLQRPIVILYAARLDHVWHEIFRAAGFDLVVGACLFGLTAVVMILTLNHQLQPIQELAARAAKVSMSTLTFDPPASALALAEIEPLARTLSSTMARLQEAVQRQHQFVSDGAHELKTAVAVMRSTAQVLMMKSRSSNEYQEGLERLLEDNGRIERLVAQMLLLARLEERPDIDPCPISLSGAILGVLESLQSYAAERKVKLSIDLQENVFVRLPTESAEIITTNLVMNAVQHSLPDSQVEVMLRCADGIAFLRVRDEGCGISAEALPHVFERFYREDRSRSRSTGGTGLGLAICKSIVDSAQGSIAIESQLGLGTRISVSFSLA
jgi:signal transduction histidine kinase